MEQVLFKFQRNETRAEVDKKKIMYLCPLLKMVTCLEYFILENYV